MGPLPGVQGQPEQQADEAPGALAQGEQGVQHFKGCTIHGTGGVARPPPGRQGVQLSLQRSLGSGLRVCWSLLMPGRYQQERALWDTHIWVRREGLGWRVLGGRLQLSMA